MKQVRTLSVRQCLALALSLLSLGAHAVAADATHAADATRAAAPGQAASGARAAASRPAVSTLPAQIRPFTVDDMVRLKRISDPQVSPDGRYVVYVLRETDMEANKGRTDLWLVDLTAKTSTPRRLTQNEADDFSPRWSPDGRWIYFLSTRSGLAQVWRLSLDGGEASRVTDYPLDVGSLKVSPSGDRLAVTMEVLPECTELRCTQEKLAAREKSKATGRVYDRLFIRHWDTWGMGTRSHIFTARINADGHADSPLDLSRQLDADVPPKPFGDDDEYAFSPDGTTLVFAARIAGRTEAWSTNFDLYQVPVDRAAQPQNLTSSNTAEDTQPVFLKNGDLAYLAMERPTAESDRLHIVLREARTGKARPLTLSWDRSILHLRAMPDGRNLLVTVQDVGQTALYSVEVATGTPHRIVGTGEVSAFAALKDSIVYAWGNLAAPADLYEIGRNGGTPRRLTQVNAELLGRRSLSEFEQFSFAGANAETVYGYVMKPYGFEPGRKYPVALLIHGGPEGSMANIWHYRWNAQAFAGGGYGVVMIDFHGSTGYGQAFTDSIVRDWGGKPLVDLQKGLENAVGRYAWLDGERACALGGSYGGFMIAWIAGNWPDRFRCLVNHDGVFEQRSMYYSTEELWFNEWENGGPYFEVPQNYEQFNPANFVTKWKTPMLIVHGERDFRVPSTQGIAAFTALQRRGIESRLLIFPDENHWVLKPNNVVQWYQTVLGWLEAHLKQ
ncbi:MAG TPA: S9 family peptidase [Steroidobacteraceae bacterium]|nr:S9 family peptidase [Steroidobacteraceae bacterium]